MSAPRFQFSLRTACIAVLMMGGILYVNFQCRFVTRVIVDAVALALTACYIAYVFEKSGPDTSLGTWGTAIAELAIYGGILAIIAVILVFAKH